MLRKFEFLASSGGKKRLSGGLVLLALSACISFAGLTGGDDAGGSKEGSMPPNDGVLTDTPRKTDSNGGAPDTTSDVGDAAPPLDCGTFANPPASSLKWDFTSDASVDWFHLSNTCAEQVDASLVIPATPAYCFYQTVAHYHLTCDSVTFKVPQTPPERLGVQTDINFTTASSSVTLILEAGGFQMKVGGVAASFTDATYSPSDLWWRFREAGGTLYFDTSADGTNWNVRGSAVSPISLDDVVVGISVGQYRTHEETDADYPIPDAGESQFRCYNIAPSSCP